MSWAIPNPGCWARLDAVVPSPPKFFRGSAISSHRSEATVSLAKLLRIEEGAPRSVLSLPGPPFSVGSLVNRVRRRPWELVEPRRDEGDARRIRHSPLAESCRKYVDRPFARAKKSAESNHMFLGLDFGKNAHFLEAVRPLHLWPVGTLELNDLPNRSILTLFGLHKVVNVVTPCRCRSQQVFEGIIPHGIHHFSDILQIIHGGSLASLAESATLANSSAEENEARLGPSGEEGSTLLVSHVFVSGVAT